MQVLCPIIVGREPELGEIEHALAAARAGAGATVFLIGEAGIGKSRLAREAGDKAESSAMRILRGRAASGAVPTPYRSLIDALGSVLRSARFDDPEMRPFRAVLEAFAPDDVSSGQQTHGVLVFEALLRLLGNIGRRDGALLVLEDLHWADPDTLGLVDYLADSLTNERLVCLCTLRDEPGPALDLAEELDARRAAVALRLGRLSAERVEEMTKAALGVEAVPRELLVALDRRAEGVPFVVEEMLTTYMASGGDADAPTSLPHTFRELVRGRLSRVDERTRSIVLAAAVIGRAFDWSLLGDVSGLDRAQVLGELHAAVKAQLILAEPSSSFEMPFRFRHALVREALLAELLPPERAELSAQAADAIERRFPGLPGDWCERVAELREAAGDRTAAARHLQEAAQRAVGRGAVGSAIDMLEHARLLTAGDRWHTIGVDRQLIDALSLAGRTDRLREIGAQASAFIDEKRRLLPGITLARGEIHLRIARAMAAAGDDAAVDEHLAQARDYLEQTGEQRVWAALRAFESERSLLKGDLAGARASAAEALATAERLGLEHIVAEARSVAGNAMLLSGDQPGALEAFTSARDDARRPLHRLRALLDLGSLQALVDGSIETLEEVCSLAEEFGALELGNRAELAIAEALIDAFDLSAAGSHLDRCIQASRRYNLAQLPAAHVLEARRLALAGDRAGGIRMLEATQIETNDARLTRAVIALLDEDVDGARGALARARFGTAPALAALLAAATGDASDPRPLVGGVAAGLLTHRVAISERKVTRFSEADAALARFPWWRHVARRLVAEAAIGAGWAEPAVWLGETLAFFEDAGLDRNVQACRALLRRAGAPVPRKGRGDSTVPAPLRARGVTSREMDVLRLVAEGSGNREIAGRLFLSPRTVETHVANLMRKLGTGSREELAAELRRLDTEQLT